MKKIQIFFTKIVCFLLIVVLNSNVLLFAEDTITLDGSYLIGCSFLEKSLFGLSNFRNREYEFTDTHLIVTDFKSKSYTQYSYIISENYIHLKKEKGSTDYFDDVKMKFEISSKSLLSKRQLTLWPSSGKPLKFVEEESLRKRASDVALGTAVAGLTVAVAAKVAMAASLTKYLKQFGFPKASDYKKMNLNQKFRKYEEGETNGYKLKQNLIQAGVSAPKKNFSAHHIIPKRDKNAVVARKILEEVDIDLNNPINGVFLPTDKEFAKISGMAYHDAGAYMHRPEFLSGLTEALQRVRGDKNGIKLVMEKARDLLLKGENWR